MPSYCASPLAVLDPEIVAQSVFWGNVDAQGNARVTRFNDELGELPPLKWPEKIVFHGVGKGAQPKFRFGNFKKREQDGESAIYVAADKAEAALAIVAFAPSLAVEAVELSDGSEGRPLAPGEADEIKRKKKSGASILSDCTTVPGYLNEAVVLLKASIAETKSSIRISSYDDPGCMGYLETVYVLDVLEDGRHEEAYQLRQKKD